MKKIICFLVVMILLSCMDVNAKSIWDKNLININKESSCIKEESIPIRNLNNKVIGIDTYLTIDESCKDKELTISPNLFGALNEYKYIMPGDKIKINVHIKNNSEKEYLYKDNSLIISTDDITKNGISENFNNYNGIGFDQRKIYEIFYPYRTYNSALKELVKSKDLSDESINKELINKNYKGIEELHKYYLDFYNNKYNLSEKSLDGFTYSVIKEMFSGNMVEVKESNKEVVELSYNYFYNKLLSISFENEVVKDSNSEDYSIGSYMNTNKGNNYFKESFNKIGTNEEKSLDNISININGLYTTNIYMYYNFLAHLEFKLESEKEADQEVFLEENEIIPPDTGI